jgi:hypothetical protein
MKTKNFSDLQALVQEDGSKLELRPLLAVISRLKSVPASSPRQKLDLLKELLQLVEPQLQQCQPRGLGEVMLACAQLGYVPASLYNSCLHAFVSKRHRADSQALANVVYAVAKAPDDSIKKQWGPIVQQQLLPGYIGKLGTDTPQGIANVIWGVATIGQQLHAEQLQQLLAGFIGKLGTASPQDISMAIWGVATMGQQLPAEQLQQLVRALAAKLPSADPQNVANTMWGVARLQPQPFFPAPLLEIKAKQAIIRMVPAMIPQAVSNIAWACGVLGYADEQLLLPLFNKARDKTLSRRSSVRDVGDNVQGVANMCWAAAVLNMQQLVSHVEQFAAAISSRWGDVVAEGKQQLYQVHMWLLDLHSNSKGLLGCLSEQQLQECREQWQKLIFEVAALDRTSPAHQAVFKVATHLPGLSQPPKLEGLTADGLHSIDVLVVTGGGVPVAIEVDGPRHFRQPDLQPTGKTQWRNRSLAARGYVVVSVPYWEWNQLPAAERVGYLEGKIQQGLAGASGGVVPDAGAAAPAC